ncbi:MULTISPECIES: VacJ family lipoprotein [unclassified Endozoicomonas]|uniref:MlaA family lipoprotein n=1 Tax=unclassified Endozoicomonas TaxID=2644528 RepID=UPI0021496EA1|nr:MULTISPECIES: VacJ family lipoprotein [unclassified Endozoicomonas]
MPRAGLLLLFFSLIVFNVLADQRIPYADPMDTLKFRDTDDELLENWHHNPMSFMDVYDPLESFNREVFAFNRQLDRYFLEPVMQLYETVTPFFVRIGIAHFFQNLKEVSTLMNNLLQFEGERAVRSVGRLFINSTLGMLGFFDPAESMGLPHHPNEFGNTLAKYGVGPGPYLVVPVIGPFSLRDVSGLVVDLVAEDYIDFLGVPAQVFSEPELFAIYGINYRYTVPMSYDDFSSPFSYDIIRFLYTRKRELEVGIIK